jgi:anti-sigma-K factor RskA
MVAIMAAPNMRSHEYYEELLAAYALDAVSGDERAEMEQHLAGCDTCPVELTEMQATVAELALLADPVEPPAGLRERIRHDALNASKTEPMSIRSVPVPLSEPILFSQFRDRLLPWGMAAVFLIAALALLAWNLELRQDATHQAVQTMVLRPADDPTGDAGVLHYFPDAHVLVVAPRDLPELAPGEVYQIWLIADGPPIPVGILHSAGERVAIAANRAEYQAVAITIEPGPLGSPQPTQDPVIVTPLKSS